MKKLLILIVTGMLLSMALVTALTGPCPYNCYDRGGCYSAVDFVGSFPCDAGYTCDNVLNAASCVIKKYNASLFSVPDFTKEIGETIFQCDDGQAAIGGMNSNDHAWLPRYLRCSNLGGPNVYVNRTSAYTIDSATVGGSFFCNGGVFGSNSTVCGIALLGWGNGIDMLTCCKTQGFIVNYSDYVGKYDQYYVGTNSWLHMFCPEAHPVVCGGQNGGGRNDRLDAIYCCGVTIEDNSAVCSDVVDNDNDGLVDCADPSCLGVTKIDGTVCGGNELNCNNGIDDNNNGKIDMNDDYCRNIVAIIPPAWDISRWNIVKSFPTYNASSMNGKDGVCGDDDWLNGGFER
jgi:hypothetical protein